MKLAYSSNAYMRFSVEEAIARIARIGFTGMELMADVPHAFPEDVTTKQIDLIRSLLRRHGLELSNVNAFMMNAVGDFWHPSWIEPDQAHRRRRIDHTVAALRMAGKLGAKCITTEPGGPIPEEVSREEAMNQFVSGLNEALAVAQEVGVSLLVEPEPGLLVENADQFLALADRIHSPMFGLNFDVGHFYCVGDSLPETIARLAHLTRHYHLEDIAKTRIHKHLIPGRGAIAFEEVIEAIRATGYDGWLTIELYPYLDDPDRAGSEAMHFLRELLPA